MAGGAAARVGPQQPQHHRRRLCGPAPTLLAGHRSEPKTPKKERSSIRKQTKHYLAVIFIPQWLISEYLLYTSLPLFYISVHLFALLTRFSLKKNYVLNEIQMRQVFFLQFCIHKNVHHSFTESYFQYFKTLYKSKSNSRLFGRAAWRIPLLLSLLSARKQFLVASVSGGADDDLDDSRAFICIHLHVLNGCFLVQPAVGEEANLLWTLLLFWTLPKKNTAQKEKRLSP